MFYIRPRKRSLVTTKKSRVAPVTQALPTVDTEPIKTKKKKKKQDVGILSVRKKSENRKELQQQYQQRQQLPKPKPQKKPVKQPAVVVVKNKHGKSGVKQNVVKTKNMAKNDLLKLAQLLKDKCSDADRTKSNNKLDAMMRYLWTIFY